MDVTTIGLDLAKNVFQVHGVDDEGTVVIRRQLRRSWVLPFFKKLAVPDWHRSLRHGALLGSATDRVGSLLEGGGGLGVVKIRRHIAEEAVDLVGG